MHQRYTNTTHTPYHHQRQQLKPQSYGGSRNHVRNYSNNNRFSNMTMWQIACWVAIYLFIFHCMLLFFALHYFPTTPDATSVQNEPPVVVDTMTTANVRTAVKKEEVVVKVPEEPLIASTIALGSSKQKEFLNDPLVTHMFTADPSAHVFNGKLFIYPSHDYDFGIPENDAGDHFDMRDYHVLSLDIRTQTVTTSDHGIALDIKTVPWAGRQMWAPDAAEKNGMYYLYFPVKDKDDIFRIGVATSNSPTGPFKAQPKAIQGSFTIDPAVFQDDDGNYYIYVGGIMGGQLQRWKSGNYNKDDDSFPADDQPALKPLVAKLADDLLELAEPLKGIEILDPATGKSLLAGDHDRRFFEASWVHKNKGKYYFSYSTGDTHFIQYATGDSPYGPFTYGGKILEPVFGWTNHHSIVDYNGKWFLFYHDSSLSGGKTHLRCVKMTELIHNPDGSIQTIDAYLGD